ncbi:MAG: efflux RND transporter permease subunit, partial [Pseudomonadota bacterium]
MKGLVQWCTDHARMVMAFIVISVAAGLISYISLPKEGSPDIDVPVLYVSVPLPGVSAIDSERLMVKPLETELRGLDNLKQMTGIASQSHAAVLLEFEFEWDKQATLADVRDRVSQAEAEFPEAAEEPKIFEVNLSEFPVLVVSLSGEVPERMLLKLAKDLKRATEASPQVLEAKLTGHREEMLEVLIDPLKLESYNVTAQELLTVIDRNNQLVAAGDVESETATFSVSVPGSFETARDVYDLPVKVNGDRVITLGDVTEIRRTFEDAEGEARYNGNASISLQISKRIGENIIETVANTRGIVETEMAKWPEPLRQAVRVDISMDESTRVRDMVGQLEGSVATAVIFVMMVVLATLGFRSALLVGMAIPSSFLLSFALLSVFGMPINNMVMFGLILAVGMLVDGAIVVVEYADKQIQKGEGPMRAYGAAAKRMFWPITASVATTLCAFLPMLLWPGMPGQFMGQLPVTLIFVLSASLIV